MHSLFVMIHRYESNHWSLRVTGTMRRRPFGVTVASILLGWLAVGGFGNAIVWNLHSVQETLHRLGKHLGGSFLTLIALAYGAAAAATCVGLWRMRPWATCAYSVWAIAVLMLFGYFAFGGFGVPPSVILAFSVFVATILFAGYLYLRWRML